MLPDRTLPRLSRSAAVLLLLLLFASITRGQDEAPASSPVESPESGASAVDFAAPFPEDSGEVFARAAELTDGAEESVVVLHESVYYVVHEDGRVDRSNRSVYRVLHEDAIEGGWASISVDWSPWFENRPEVRARVYLADGTTRDLDPATITDADRHQGDEAFYSDGRVVRAPLPAVSVGAIVERETRVTAHAPHFAAGHLVRYPFGYRGIPTRVSRATIDAPASKPVRYRVDGPEADVVTEHTSDGRGILVIERRDLEVCEPLEPYADTARPSLTTLSFTTGSSWADVAAEYGDLVDASIAETVELTSLAARILGPDSPASADSDAQPNERPNPAALTNRIMSWLGANLRYTALSLGDGAIVPRAPHAVVESGFGDCKDLAALVCTILRDRGIPAHVALLDAGFEMDVSHDLPGLGRFDHAIVYVDGQDGGWIDPTFSLSRFGTLPPACQGRLALIVPRGSHSARSGSMAEGSLVTTPVFDAHVTHVVEQRDYYFPIEGNARTVEVARPTGNSERSYRNTYGNSDQDALRENLTSYANSVYGGTISRVEVTDCADLTTPLVLRIEVDEARFLCDGDEAAIAIQETPLFARLPDFLKEPPPSEKRKAPLVLDDAHGFDIRCRVHLPPGMLPRDPPPNEEIRFGPAKYTREFHLDEDGTFHARFVFDTGGRFFEPDEAQALHEGVYERASRDSLVLFFRLPAARQFEEGEIAAALDAYRKLAAEHPQEDFYQRRVARALLAGGLGDAARAAARRATEIDPESALAFQNLGFILLHDRVGRLRQPGQDHAAALAALQRACELDPDASLAAAELAIAYEFDENGRRFWPGARPVEAARLAKEFRDRFDSSFLDVNRLYCLFFAGLDDELTEFVDEADGSSTCSLFRVVATALDRGAPEALRVARKEFPDPEARSRALTVAGTLLVKRREYLLAADIADAAVNGAPNPVSIRTWATGLRKLQKVDVDSIPLDDPRGLVIRYAHFGLTDDIEGLASTVTPSIIEVLGHEQLIDYIRPEANRTREKLDMPPAPALDAVSSVVEIDVDGTPEAGYRIDEKSGTPTRYFAVPDAEGRLRIAGLSGMPSSLGYEALRRVQSGDAEGAKQWLDWAHEETGRPPIFGDPIAGSLFHKVWSKDRASDVDAKSIEIAAAVLMEAAIGTDAHLEVLSRAFDETPDEDPRSLAITKAYTQALVLRRFRSAEDDPRLLELTEKLRRLVPSSPMAEGTYLIELAFQGRLDEAWEAAAESIDHSNRERQRTGGTLRAAVHFLRGEHVESAEMFHSMIESGVGNADTMSAAALTSLFAPGLPAERDFEAAAEAVRRTKRIDKKAEYLLLQAALFAATGMAAPAVEHLHEAMSVLGRYEPESGHCYVLGLLAEHFGELDVAREAYAQSVTLRKDIDRHTPLHLADLAKKRLDSLGSSGVQSAGE